MNIANHFPSKKRRDSEIDITPTRITPGGKHKTNQDVRHKVKRSRVYSPSCNSSDESMIEISWDNNSPSPRRAFSGRRKKSDIASIINKISKKKNSDLIKKDNDESLLTTWKLGNLPSSNSFQLSTKPRRLSARRSIQTKVTTKFSDELKRFLEGVNLAGCNAIEDPCIRRSPRLIAMKTKIASSPVTSERFDQGVYYNGKNVTPHRKYKLPLVDSICATPTTQKSEKNFVSTEKKCPLRLSLPKNSLNFNRSKKETSDFIDIDLNDGLDAIISSHIENYDHTASLNKSAENLVDAKTNRSRDSSNESESCKELTDGFFTKIKPDIYEKDKNIIEKKTEIVTTPKRQMLVDFNDTDGFDELLIDLDDEIRCKSQEVTRLTPSQRVLRTRSMTSPFPLNKSFNRQSKLAEKEKLTENHNKSIDLDTLSLHSPIKITPVAKVLHDKNSSSNVVNSTYLSKCPNLQKNISSQIHNKVCPKPSVLTGKRSSMNGTVYCNIPSIKDIMPLNLSFIEKSGKENYLEDEPIALDMPVRNRPTPFMSTQRCSYSEIERKRQEAQNRLKEKLKKRRK